mmetsp:Transcript_62433/g.139394  ORF Transcript_62433/g.139394 Transcript_62433/m.139394 type:complete len:217 (-) Transcript_62433:160-810(-)
MWKPMFQSGVCLVDPTMITTSTSTTTEMPTTTTMADVTTTKEAITETAVEVAIEIVVEDPTVITENKTVTTAMRKGMAELMNVSLDMVELTFEEVPARRLSASRKLSVTLKAIFRVIVPNVEAATELSTVVQKLSTDVIAQELATELTEIGFTPAVAVTKAPVVTLFTTSSTTTTAGEGKTTTTTSTQEPEDDAPDSAVAGKLSAVVLIAAVAVWN